MVPISLIPKPDGGDRPIGVTPLLCAIFFKAAACFVTDWDVEHMNFWEDAIRGSSALLAGLRRRLLDECATAVGYETAAIYWDLRNFTTRSVGPWS